jgi:hypothetical protein
VQRGAAVTAYWWGVSVNGAEKKQGRIGLTSALPAKSPKSIRTRKVGESPAKSAGCYECPVVTWGLLSLHVQPLDEPRLPV